MKTIVKTTAVIAFVLTTAIGMARDGEVRLRTIKEAKSVVLTLEKVLSDVTVRITDADDNLLYAETLADGTLVKRFDMRNLPEGMYYISTSDVYKTLIYTVSLKNGEANILLEENIAKPHFRKTKEKMFINFLNLDKSKVEIKVYDAEYRVVFSETITEKMIVEKAFDFKKAFAGNYRIVVTDAKNSYAENFIVD